ncbi:MAG: DUF488 family protein [Patescibacteria group bacterium]|nr:DUF488 family protein [Patescibacteria group bacterium]MDD5121711.1 DUF488 family protein [Patescibacteria group bacterium]MDD5221706.1 DUF488 family protein [Patescibacteria group bacterium]MDD5396125.1 DUF488 family protein [Patescibacteria group bacterium]
MIALKRIYEPYKKDDGFRVLVDRLWPRGISKSRAKINLWLKDIGPSNELRKWFSHREDRWMGFKKNYKQELRGKQDLLIQLANLSKKRKKLTLLYGAKDEKHNQAVVIKEMLRQ